MKSLLTKRIISLLLSFVILFTSVSATYAQTWYNQNFTDFYRRVYTTDTPPSEIFGERYTAAQVQWVMWSIPSIIMNLFLGVDVSTCLLSNLSDFSACSAVLIDWFTYNPTSNLAQPPTLSSEDFIASHINNNPFSGIGYITRAAEKISLIQTVHAQSGFGFTALENPVQRVWVAARNMSYALFILIIIVLAFMVMFRTKTSPQTVITIQSALPRIAIGLLLVTFSYAIAGFMIDLLYVVIGLLAALITQSGIVVPGTLQTGTVWGDVYSLLTDGMANSGAIGWLGQYMAMFNVGFFAVGLRVLFSPDLAAIAIGTIMVGLFPILLLLIEILLIVITIRTLWMFFMTYVRIIFAVMLGPFQILLGVLTPAGGGFSTWLRNLISHLIVYPVAGFMFFLALMFLAGAMGPIGVSITNLAPWGLNFDPNLFQGNVWDPPLTVGTGNFQPLLLLMVSLAIMAAIPHTVQIIQGLLTGRPFTFGTAIGTAIAPIAGPGQAAWGATRAGGWAAADTSFFAGTGSGLWGRAGRALNAGTWSAENQARVKGFFEAMRRGR